MNKKVSVLLICLGSATILIFVGMIQKNQTFIILACANVALGSTFYAIGGAKEIRKGWWPWQKILG